MYSNEHPPAAMGRAVPDLTLSCRLPGDRGSLEIRLRDRGGRWAMIAFLPPRRHHGCAGEIAALDAHANVLRARGCDVFAIATASEREDPVELGSPWHSSGGTVAMLRRVVDREGEIAGRFGVAPPVIDGGARAVFLVDPQGRIRLQLLCDVCLGQGILEPSRLLSSLQASEDCPRQQDTLPSAPPAAPAPHPGRRFGHFAVEERLGEGAFSVVYRGRDTRLDRAVALKLLRPGQHVDLAVVLHEAKVAATLNHPNIGAIHDVLESTGAPMIVMELLPGGTLWEQMRGGVLRSRRAQVVLGSIARALAALHGAGVVHGDLKPGNVMFTADGTPKLVDFGVALLDGQRVVPSQSDDSTSLRSGTTIEVARSSADVDTVSEQPLRMTPASSAPITVVCGTPAYMAPELIEGALPSPASDVWALGVLVAEVVTGSKPFEGDGFVELLSDQLRSDPRRLARGVPPRWREVVRSTLVIEPSRRATADQVARMLGSV